MNLKNSFRMFNKKDLFNMFFLDFMTVFSYTLFSSFFLVRALDQILGAFAESLSEILEQQNLFTGSFNIGVGWLVLFFISIYLSYSFFQSLSWKIALTKFKKIKNKKYLKKFFRLNLIWLPLFFLMAIVSAIILGIEQIRGSMFVLKSIILFGTIILFSMAVSSYNIPKNFWNFWKKSIPIFLSLILALQIISFMIQLIPNNSVFLFFLKLFLEVFVMIPSITISRIIYIESLVKK